MKSGKRSPGSCAGAPAIRELWTPRRPSWRRMLPRTPTPTTPISRGRNRAMPLKVSYDEVKDGANVLQVRGGAMLTKMVYGNDCNMMLAVRAPGYHSHPHTHDAEQLNYLLEGEVWVFVEDDGFLMRKGDFCRIPRNAVHWAWNRGDA